MKIKHRVQIHAVVSVLVSVSIAVVLILAIYRLHKANELSIFIGEMMTSSLERVTFRSDYLRHNSLRAKERFFTEGDHIDGLLKSGLQVIEDSEGRTIIEKMIENQEATTEVFSAIVNNRERSELVGDRARFLLEAEERLVTQLHMKVYAFVILGRTLQEQSIRARDNAVKLAGGGVSALVVIIATAVLNTFVLRRVITDRVNRLREGAGMIGGGDLGHRIDIPGNDEFTDLAMAFNTMTGKLSGLYHDLEVEIMERKKTESSLQSLNDTLEERVEQRTLELQKMQQQYLHAEKLTALGKMAASIAHEFNNPLQAIMIILQGTQKSIADDSDRKMLELAIEEGNRIKRLIRSLQDFYRPSSERKELVDLHTILDTLFLLLKTDFKRKKISLECDYALQLPHISVVADQIKQVFMNLLANAVEACPESGGTITVSTRHQGENIIITIKDTGSGIKPHHLEHIFRPFFTTKAAVKGTGLGLSVSYGIVKKHGGEILVESKPGAGATFTVVLPVNDGLTMGPS